MLAVLGGNAMALPAIRRLQDRYAVLVVDGSAASPGGRIADAFVHQNFSDVEATGEALRDIPLAGILPLTDFAIAAAARIARDRDLPGWSTRTEACVRSKVAMKQAWMANGLPTARVMHLSVDDVMMSSVKHPWFSWPC